MSREFMPIEKFYSLKRIFERLWGKDTYLELKHCSDIKIWKKYATKTLKASLLAINVSVEIKDDEWQKETEEIINRGIANIMGSECVSFEDLFSRVCTTYIELSFCQIGFVPQRPLGLRQATLTPKTWQLNMIRTVQYVQSSEQKKIQEIRKSRKQTKPKTIIFTS